MRHIFIDVEAFGAPGFGRVFAVGAVLFTMAGILARRQFIFRQKNPQCGTGHLRWLLAQSDEVRKQAIQALSESHPPDATRQDWYKLVQWISPEENNEKLMVWADDYSDFAWLEAEATLLEVPSLRNFVNCQADSSAILKIAGIELNLNLPNLIPHVAVDDATLGATQLIHALRTMGQELPKDQRTSV